MLLLMCALSACATLDAQVLEKSYGLELGYHAGGQRISGGSGITIRSLERQDSLESGRPGYSVGLLFESRAGKVGFTTGLRYLRAGYEVNDDGSDGPGLGRDFRDEVTAHYLEVPFELNFHQDVNERDRMLFMLGVAANVHLNTAGTRSVSIDGVGQGSEPLPEPTDGYRPVVGSLNAGIGYDRKLGEDWAVRVQPYFRFFLQGNLRESLSQFNRNYYQTGVRVVVKRLFL